MGKKTVSFLVSGRGSNFTAIVKQIKKGAIKAKPGIVISDRKEAKALDIARDFGMESFFVDQRAHSEKEGFETEMVNLLRQHKTDLIVTAGFMKVLSPYFVNAFKFKIINIHPALLPSFPGAHGQQDALEYGVKISGCTAHFIDEGVDTGPIIMQATVPVLENDTVNTLSARILKEEHRILPEAVKLFCEGKLSISGRTVNIL